MSLADLERALLAEAAAQDLSDDEIIDILIAGPAGRKD